MRDGGERGGGMVEREGEEFLGRKSGRRTARGDKVGWLWDPAAV